MSDSWIAWKPRIDEPSNIWPSTKNSLVTVRGHVEVLHHARQVAEPDIDELDVLVLDEREDLVRCAEHLASCDGRAGRRPVRREVTILRPGFPAMTRMFRRCYASGGEVRSSDIAYHSPDTRGRRGTAAYRRWRPRQRRGLGFPRGGSQGHRLMARGAERPDGRGGDYPGQRLGMRARAPARSDGSGGASWVSSSTGPCAPSSPTGSSPCPSAGRPRSFVVLVVFAVENLLLVGTLFTIGHRIAGLRVRSISGVRPGPCR